MNISYKYTIHTKNITSWALPLNTINHEYYTLLIIMISVLAMQRVQYQLRFIASQNMSQTDGSKYAEDLKLSRPYSICHSCEPTLKAITLVHFD